MNKYVIIVAGGSGIRMGADIPKQFIEIAGKPMLMHTLESFTGHSPEIKIILVLPGFYINYWWDLCKTFSFNIQHEVVSGGNIRSESVRNGLKCIKEPEALVAVHDGVRPFPDSHTIEKAFNLASEFGSAIPGREITDSVRIIENGNSRPFDRKSIRSIQTPQCFRLSILRDAYQVENIAEFTDDAGLVGSHGYDIHLFEGNPENIKITTPYDLLIAEAIQRNRKK
jgi:2-C-methyl-D-erythritol 4-phosphate cytidylyltransferase